MARSNVANGANYFDLVFQLVSDDGVTRVMRAVVYLQSYNVTDSSNSFDVSEWGYSRGGAYSFSGVYNYVPIWYKDIAFTRNVGSDYTISVYAAISGVNYWATTLSAREYTTIPARYEAPSAPGTGVDSITPTSARILVSASSYAGGAKIDAYEAYVMTNNAWPGAGGNVVASASGGTFVANNLLPSTTYYYTARAHNTAGLWSGWTPMQVFTTLPSALVNVAGVWKNAIPYVNDAGTWKMTTPYVNVGGVWKLA